MDPTDPAVRDVVRQLHDYVSATPAGYAASWGAGRDGRVDAFSCWCRLVSGDGIGGADPSINADVAVLKRKWAASKSKGQLEATVHLPVFLGLLRHSTTSPLVEHHHRGTFGRITISQSDRDREMGGPNVQGSFGIAAPVYLLCLLARHPAEGVGRLMLKTLEFSCGRYVESGSVGNHIQRLRNRMCSLPGSRGCARPGEPAQAPQGASGRGTTPAPGHGSDGEEEEEEEELGRGKRRKVPRRNTTPTTTALATPPPALSLGLATPAIHPTPRGRSRQQERRGKKRARSASPRGVLEAAEPSETHLLASSREELATQMGSADLLELALDSRQEEGEVTQHDPLGFVRQDGLLDVPEELPPPLELEPLTPEDLRLLREAFGSPRASPGHRWPKCGMDSLPSDF